jgi:cell division protein FtsB
MMKVRPVANDAREEQSVQDDSRPLVRLCAAIQSAQTSDADIAQLKAQMQQMQEDNAKMAAQMQQMQEDNAKMAAQMKSM